MSLRNTKKFSVTGAEKVKRRRVEDGFRVEGGLVPSQEGPYRPSTIVAELTQTVSK